MKFAVLLSVVCLSQSVFAHEHPAPAMPKEFDTLKGLVGTWEGKNKMHDQEVDVTVTYELTSGGTAIAERLMPGTPQEMLTVYHREGKSVGMTHYCALGNQPKMHLKKATAGSLAFEMTKAEGVSSMKEDHMHALTLTMTDHDTLKQEWIGVEKGKKHEAVFNYKRKK